MAIKNEMQYRFHPEGSPPAANQPINIGNTPVNDPGKTAYAVLLFNPVYNPLYHTILNKPKKNTLNPPAKNKITRPGTTSKKADRIAARKLNKPRGNGRFNVRVILLS